MKVLSKANSGLKSKLIFFSSWSSWKRLLHRKFQAGSAAVLYETRFPRLITDVDFYTWFSGYGKWQIYSMRTFNFYCRLSHLVTFGWLWVEHLHQKLDLQWETATASRRRVLAGPRPTQRGCDGRPTLLSAISRGSSAAAFSGSPPPSLSSLLALQKSNHRASLCVHGDRDGKGEVGQRGSSEGCLPGSVLLPRDVCMHVAVAALPFLPCCRTLGRML